MTVLSPAPAGAPVAGSSERLAFANAGLTHCNRQRRRPVGLRRCVLSTLALTVDVAAAGDRRYRG
jgi:hypothetical protein